MTEIQTGWTEEDSQLYREIASVAVPGRDEQIATLLTLLPFDQAATFRAVDLACGEGGLAYAILDYFPHASVLALDGSPTMLAQASNALRQFGSRASVLPFNLAAWEWLSLLKPVDCVVSSLSLHHLAPQDKKRLFREISQRLPRRGAVLIADLIAPQREEVRLLYAGGWDRSARAQSLALTGSTEHYEKFTAAEWNYYRHPDPMDQPSSLFDQLIWLKEAGFEVADCFWLQAGHAIYGGYKARRGAPVQNRSLEAALESARRALHATSPLP